MAPISVEQVSAAHDVAVSIARPANTLAYSAGDDVCGVYTFASVGQSGSVIMITGTQLEIDIAAVPAGMTGFRLHLYSVTPPSAFPDNSSWDLPAGDRASYLGSIDLGSPSDLGSSLYVELSNINKQIKLTSANLYGYLVTIGGYTPAASTVYKLTLHTLEV